MPSTGCRSTSTRSCGGPGPSASDRHGRASKGGSPWRPRSDPASPGPAGRSARCWWSRSSWPSSRPRCCTSVHASTGCRRRSVPARNGIVLSSGNGDIVQVDPASHTRTTLIGGPTFDFGPGFSRDGTRFLFLRGAPSDCGKPDCGLYLMAANADGSDVRQLTSGMPALDWADWSPDGSRIAFLTADPSGPGRVLAVVNADGSGLRIDTVGRPVYPAGWLPPNGDEIVIRGEHVTAGDPTLGALCRPSRRNWSPAVDDPTRPQRQRLPGRRRLAGRSLHRLSRRRRSGRVPAAHPRPGHGCGSDPARAEGPVRRDLLARWDEDRLPAGRER